MQTREQRYATTVYAQVVKIKDEQSQKIDPKKYGSLCHQLPVLIRTAGLVQALAFVEARKKDLGMRLLADLSKSVGVKSIVNESRAASLGNYMLLTQKTLDALLWYKRFAQSVLDVNPEDRVEEELENT